MNRLIETHGTGRRINTLAAYMIGTAVAGLAGVARVLPRSPLPDAATTLLYLALGMVGEHLSVRFPTGYSLTLGDQVALAALWCYGYPLAVLSLVPAVLVQFFTKKKALLNSLFNGGQYAVSMACASIVARAASAVPGGRALLGQVFCVMLMVLTFDAVNTLFVAVGISIDQEQPWVSVFVTIAVTERRNSLVLLYLINMASIHLAIYMGKVGVVFMFAGILALWAQLQFEQGLAKKSLEAQTDVLTGLYNVRYLEDWLNGDFPRIASREAKCSMVFVDVDRRLKEVNDSLGHDAGDALLVHLAKVLTSVIRSGDRVVRYGGDEFILICHNADLPEAEGIGQRIIDAIRKTPLFYAGDLLAYGVSVGVATFPKHSTLGRDLIRMADKAMYLAKKHGGNIVYTADSL